MSEQQLMVDSTGFSGIQLKLWSLLRDCKFHDSDELSRLLDPAPDDQTKKSMRVHLCWLRAKLRKAGYDILTVRGKPTAHRVVSILPPI